MDPAQLYRDLGCKPVINASGNQTILGGSRVSPAVQEAMIAANRHYVEMRQLQLQTGAAIAAMVGAEAAFVTPAAGLPWPCPPPPACRWAIRPKWSSCPTPRAWPTSSSSRPGSTTTTSAA